MRKITKEDLIIEENAFKISITPKDEFIEEAKKVYGNIEFRHESTDYTFTSRKEAIEDFLNTWSL